MLDATAPAFTHVFIPAEMFGILQACLGARPAAETGRLLVALESCPTGLINAPSLVAAAFGDEAADRAAHTSDWRPADRD